MGKQFLTAAAVATFGALAVNAHAAPVDLSSWVANGGGTWVLESGNNAVKQTQNGNPTVFHNNIASNQGQKLSGTIEVQTTGDDDYIGFVLGFNDGDLSNAAADYLLVDWKQGNQGSFGCNADVGLSVSRVTGQLGNNSGAWCHDPANNVTELARGTNLGSTGWADNTEYKFDLVFQQNLVEVYVDDVLELSVNGTFADGGFGFYNYSQANVRYAGIQQNVAPEIPLPAGMVLMASAIGMAGLIARKRRRNY